LLSLVAIRYSEPLSPGVLVVAFCSPVWMCWLRAALKGRPHALKLVLVLAPRASLLLIPRPELNSGCVVSTFPAGGRRGGSRSAWKYPLPDCWRSGSPEWRGTARTSLLSQASVQLSDCVWVRVVIPLRQTTRGSISARCLVEGDSKGAVIDISVALSLAVTFVLSLSCDGVAGRCEVSAPPTKSMVGSKLLLGEMKSLSLVTCF